MDLKIEQQQPRRRHSDSFQATRWSLVAALKGDSPGDAQRSLAELCQGYWYPVYAYIRRCGHAPELAYDVAQAFFARLTTEIRGAEPRSHGQFRTFLLSRLNAFLAEDVRGERSVAGEPIAGPLDVDALEARHRRELQAGATPETAFQRSFALEVLARSLRRLRAEAEQGERIAMFERLEPFLTTEPQASQYQDLARELNSRPLALVIAIKRLRSRFRELVEEELAQTVASVDDLDAERGALLAILGTER